MTDILTAPVPDHRALLIVIKGTEKKRGYGLWKLNSSVLQDELHVNEIKLIFPNTLKEYKGCSKRDIWDMCKIRFKVYIIQYCHPVETSVVFVLTLPLNAMRPFPPI